ncbi:MAG TPA: di-trans,poly-cis-decaprenylcistransferase [Chloroflexi bacterium]|nr:di-trans,poly-cis-decaprenylcistransferase [Chloroflexota bacterium]
MAQDREEHGQYPPLDRVPQHVGIIMDGNGRWARERGLPRAAGHRAGTENLRVVLRAAVEFGVPVLTIYAFSTENWGRPEGEVSALLAILERVLDRELAELHAEGVQLRHVGHLERIPSRLQEKVLYAVDLTQDNDQLILNVAFDYGGRTELVDAVRRIIKDGIPADQVDEDTISRYVYTAGLPDPDLIIRTSGEMRVSNFLIWQGAYAELYVTSTYWPDFDKQAFYEALGDYGQRDRRFGLVSR